MADKVKAKSPFDYIAHIQKEDGDIVEIAGRRHFLTHNDVFCWLQKRCTELNGWLVSQHISEYIGDDIIDPIPWKDEKKVKALPPARIEQHTADNKFNDTSIFGVFKRTYTGALPIKFKGSTSS